MPASRSDRALTPTDRVDRSSLWWASRALWQEIVRFRFDYPLDVNLAAGGRGELSYYIYSYQLFLNDQVFDSAGVPQKVYRKLGRHYNPLFVAWWGLFNLQRYLRAADQPSLERFLVQVEWLKASAQVRDDGAIVWPCYFDWQEGFCRLRAPWISAMYQGVVVSALVRAYRLTQDEDLLRISHQATKVFGKSIEDGGVRTLERGHVLYEEYPGYPLPRVLDGFLFSLLGLYDLYVETEDAATYRLFADGLDGLRATLNFWNYRHKWSWYGSHGYLCPPHYHALNWRLLAILSSLTGDQSLGRQAERWDPRGLSWRDRLQVYALFVVKKNWARLRLPLKPDPATDAG